MQPDSLTVSGEGILRDGYGKAAASALLNGRFIEKNVKRHIALFLGNHPVRIRPARYLENSCMVGCDTQLCSAAGKLTEAVTDVISGKQHTRPAARVRSYLGAC
jgi:hypothetical protein